MLRWNVGDPNGTELVGYLDFPEGMSFDEAVARLVAAGAEDDGPGDKTDHEFVGTFNGAVFTLYDYKGCRVHLHVGGHRAGGVFGGDAPALDVDGLRAALTALLETR